jgi:hypothetical protein
MKPPAQLSKARITAAFVVAVLTDLAQLPVNAAMLTGALAVPMEAVDVCLDGAAFVITTALLGFHWVLLPTLAIEAFPLAAGLPSWTGCVFFVVAQRKKAALAAGEAKPSRVVEALPSTPQQGATASPERSDSWAGANFTPRSVSEPANPRAEPGAMPEDDGP